MGHPQFWAWKEVVPERVGHPPLRVLTEEALMDPNAFTIENPFLKAIEPYRGGTMTEEQMGAAQNIAQARAPHGPQ